MSEAASSPAWWHFSHGADIGLGARASSLAALFEQMALAMSAVVTQAPIDTLAEVTIECRASDPEVLLVDWLNELIYEMATRGLIFGAFSVEIDGDRLRGVARGEPVSQRKHAPAVELKGATYTALAVRQDGPGAWQATCVVDV